MSKWKYQDFDYISLKNGQDCRVAKYMLYDFVNMFDIEKFVVIKGGVTTRDSVCILYVEPLKYKNDEIEDKWNEYVNKLLESQNDQD